MKFVNIVMLAGVFAAVLPVVLHLISRARYRPVEWGAMMFLTDDVSGTSDRTRPARWALLIVRAGAIALLALALARPVFSGTSNVTEAQRVAVVIVIDATPSMGHMEYTESRLDLARRAALTVLGQLRRGDQVGLVTLGQPVNTDVPLTTDLQDIASRLASMKVAVAPATVADGQRRATGLLAQAEGVPREIYLISDRDRAAWTGLEAPEIRPAESLRITAIPVGSTMNDNVWVESVKLASSPAVAGVPAEIVITIRNSSSVDRMGLPLVIRDGANELDRSIVDLRADSAVMVQRRLTFAQTGPQVISVNIGPAGIPGDDVSWLAVDVVDPINVVAIAGPAGTTDLDYIKLALIPYSTTGSAGTDMARLRIVSEQNWPRLDARRDNVVILSDVTQLNDQRVQALEDFVTAGGGLLIAPGDHIDIDTWNLALYLDGDGLAPAPIVSIKTDAEGIAATVPALALSSIHETKPPAQISLRRWTKLGDVFAASWKFDFSNGDSAMVGRSFGQGRVIASAIPLANRWSTLVESADFLPLMQSIVKYLGTARLTDRNRPLSSTLEARFQSPSDRFAWIARPDGRADRMTMTMNNNTGSVVYTNTDLPGRYNIRTSGTPGTDFVIYGGNFDVDLDLLNDEQLAEICRSAGIAFARAEAIKAGVGGSRRTPELTLPLMFGVLAVLGLEMFLAHRSTRIRKPVPE